jgi:hypothetical protein
MKTTLVFVVRGITTSALLVPGEGQQRALGFSIRSQEEMRVRVEGYGSIDAIAGHLRFESSKGIEANPTWNAVVFHPPSLGMPVAYGIELSVDPALLESLISDARIRPPGCVQAEVDGLSPDFGGEETIWTWYPVETPPLALLSIKLATTLTP